MTNPAVSKSGVVDSLLIEKFNGKVHEAYLKGENLRRYFDMQSVVGTNMISNKYLGETAIQALVPGQTAAATDTDADKNALVVDTAVIARNAVAQLHDVQNDIDGIKSKLAANQVKQLKKLEDTMIIQQLIYGALSNTQAARTNPRVSGHGFSIKLQISEAQAADPNCILAAVEDCLEKQILQEIEVNEVVAILPWVTFNCLMDAERLVSKDYTPVGAEVASEHYMLKSYNIPVLPSNRFPKTTAASILSKPTNGNRYTADAEQLTCIGVLFAPEALLIGMTLEVQGDIWFDKDSKSFFIDTWYAEGSIPDRWEAVSAIFTNGATENTAITKRAARKAIVQRTVTL
jgi:hypothetical protein